MSWVDQALADFGRGLGLPALELGPQGFVQLAMGQGGVLGIAQAGAEISVYLARPLQHAPARVLEHALEHCDFRRRSPFAIQAGLRGEGDLVFLARIPERVCTAPALEQAVELLSRLHEAARAA